MFSRKHRKFFAKCLTGLLVVSNIAALVPIDVSAHDAYFLQSNIDPNNKRYVMSVVKDEPGFLSEKNHLEAKLGNFSSGDFSLKADTPTFFVTREDTFKSYEFVQPELDNDGKPTVTDNEKAKASPDTGLIYTFPAKQEGGWFSKVNGTKGDMERAQLVGETLTTSLNAILNMVNDGKAFNSVDEMILTSIYIRDGSINNTKNSYTIVYGTDPTDNSLKTPFPDSKQAISDVLSAFPDADSQGNLYAYVYKNGNNNLLAGDVARFIYAMPKGYVPIDGINNGNPIIQSNIGKNNVYDFANKSKGELNDTTWLTIHHISHQANFAFNYYGYSTAGAISEESSDMITGWITDLLSNLLNGIRSFLNLYTMEELVYNSGSRTEGLYEGGMMSSDWWYVVLRYHTIAQIIAWSLIVLAIAKILIQTNFSTINPMLKVSMMETLQKLFIVGFFLVCTIPLVQLMCSFNNAFVDVMATQVPDQLRTTVSHSNLIVSILIELIFFCIDCYLNFVYIMRSIMLAVLIASAPIFIITMAFSLKGKGLLDNWLKELTANLFLQSFHAFSFAFIFAIQGNTGRGIEQVAVALSIVPLTDFFRTMLFGQSGSFATSQGAKLYGQANQFGTTVAAAGSRLGSNVGTDFANFARHRTAKGVEDGNNSSNMSSNDMANTYKQNSSDLANSLKSAGEDQLAGANHTEKSFNPSDGSGHTDKNGGPLGKKSVGVGLKALGSATNLGSEMMQVLSGLNNIASSSISGDPHAFNNGVKSIEGALNRGADSAGGVVASGIDGAYVNYRKARNYIDSKNGKKKANMAGSRLVNHIDSKTGKDVQNFSNSLLRSEGISIGSGDARNCPTMNFDMNNLNLTPEMKENVSTIATMLNSGNKEAIGFANDLGYSAATYGKDGSISLQTNENFFKRNHVERIKNNGDVTQIVRPSTHSNDFSLPIETNASMLNTLGVKEFKDHTSQEIASQRLRDIKSLTDGELSKPTAPAAKQNIGDSEKAGHNNIHNNMEEIMARQKAAQARVQQEHNDK